MQRSAFQALQASDVCTHRGHGMTHRHTVATGCSSWPAWVLALASLIRACSRQSNQALLPS
jgi:hypothetical protein